MNTQREEEEKTIPQTLFHEHFPPTPFQKYYLTNNITLEYNNNCMPITAFHQPHSKSNIPQIQFQHDYTKIILEEQSTIPPTDSGI